MARSFQGPLRPCTCPQRTGHTCERKRRSWFGLLLRSSCLWEGFSKLHSTSDSGEAGLNHSQFQVFFYVRTRDPHRTDYLHSTYLDSCQGARFAGDGISRATGPAMNSKPASQLHDMLPSMKEVE